MIQRIFKPIPELADIVEHYWYSKIELTSTAVQHYPTPLLQGLAFNFSQQEEFHAYGNNVIRLHKAAYFFGQPTCPRVITTNEKGVDILGVKFKPLGIAILTGINMEQMADCIVEAEDIWGREVDLICDEMQSEQTLEGRIRLLEIFLLKKYHQTSARYVIRNVNNALSLIEHTNGAIQIKDLQYQTNTSRKTLERAFANHLGIAPKLYSKIVRFNAAKDWMDHSVAKEKLSGIAYDLGYYDGSHFAADFKHFSSLTPREYIQESLLQHQQQQMQIGPG